MSGNADDTPVVEPGVDTTTQGIDALVGTREISSPEAMEALGEEMGRMLRPGDMVVLTGPLGAGKTTLTRGIGRGLGVRGPIQSPTFVLARTHPSLIGGAPLVHVDAYRLGSAAELDDLDIDFDGSVGHRGVGPGAGRRHPRPLVGRRARARVARARTGRRLLRRRA